MKKLFALLMVCGFALAFTACGGGKTEAVETESTETAPVEEPAIEEPVADSVAADTTAM